MAISSSQVFLHGWHVRAYRSRSRRAATLSGCFARLSTSSNPKLRESGGGGRGGGGGVGWWPVGGWGGRAQSPVYAPCSATAFGADWCAASKVSTMHARRRSSLRRRGRRDGAKLWVVRATCSLAYDPGELLFCLDAPRTDQQRKKNKKKITDDVNPVLVVSTRSWARITTAEGCKIGDLFDLQKLDCRVLVTCASTSVDASNNYLIGRIGRAVPAAPVDANLHLYAAHAVNHGRRCLRHLVLGADHQETGRRSYQDFLLRRIVAGRSYGPYSARFVYKSDRR